MWIKDNLSELLDEEEPPDDLEDENHHQVSIRASEEEHKLIDHNPHRDRKMVGAIYNNYQEE